MCLLLETIKIKDKKIYNLDYHNRRFNYSRKILFNAEDYIDLDEIIIIPGYVSDALYRCRIIYDSEIRKAEFLPYSLRKIKSLKIIHSDSIDYRFKYENRSALNELVKMKENCDEILIIKNNRITDTSVSNIVFFDNDKWFTPAGPLLKGTKREKLLEQKIIFEEEILLEDLKHFTKARLISSMIEFEDEVEIMIENIY